MPDFIQESSQKSQVPPRGPISLLSGLIGELGCACWRRGDLKRTQWVSLKIWTQERSSRGHLLGHPKNHSSPAMELTPGRQWKVLHGLPGGALSGVFCTEQGLPSGDLDFAFSTM